jgi:hypothetical protein
VAEARAAQLAALQQEAEELRQAGSSSRLAAAQVQEQLEMVATSRDTWRVGTAVPPLHPALQQAPAP